MKGIWAKHRPNILYGRDEKSIQIGRNLKVKERPIPRRDHNTAMNPED
jgi:hypothetical protein